MVAAQVALGALAQAQLLVVRLVPQLNVGRRVEGGADQEALGRRQVQADHERHDAGERQQRVEPMHDAIVDAGGAQERQHDAIVRYVAYHTYIVDETRHEDGDVERQEAQ